MKYESRIRWSKGDYITLGRAISEFNKKVIRLQKVESNIKLPLLKDYKYEKENITTRKQLNRVIKDLKKFKEVGQEKLVTLPRRW